MSRKENDGYEDLMKLRSSELLDDVHPPAFYLSRPNIRAIYTTTSSWEVSNDVHLSYFKMPKTAAYPLDLNKGFDQHIFRRKSESGKLLDKVQKFVLDSEENVLRPDEQTRPLSSADTQSKPLPNLKRKVILSQRGVLTRIMLIPYNLSGSEWHNSKFFATRYCGILHLTEIGWKDSKTINESYHGKFAQACFSDDPDLDPITNVPVDENGAVFCIHHTTVKEFDLIYSAEIAGIISDHKIDDIHNLDKMKELKFILTKLLLTNATRTNIFTHPKLLLWWLQSYLGNTNDICIGIRDSDGVVRTPAKLYKVQDIPKNALWKPHICIRFLHTMLTLVEKTMAKVNCPYTVYEFMYDSYAKCIKLKVHDGKTEHSFLSEDYIKHCKQQTDRK